MRGRTANDLSDREIKKEEDGKDRSGGGGGGGGERRKVEVTRRVQRISNE